MLSQYVDSRLDCGRQNSVRRRSRRSVRGLGPIEVEEERKVRGTVQIIAAKRGSGAEVVEASAAKAYSQRYYSVALLRW